MKIVKYWTKNSFKKEGNLLMKELDSILKYSNNSSKMTSEDGLMKNSKKEERNYHLSSLWEWTKYGKQTTKIES